MMNGYLIAEEGPLIGMTAIFEEDAGLNEWTLGRDPDVSDIVLQDPMVSRKHVIVRVTPEGFVLENLSSVNPATQNGKIIVDPVLLQEGDIIQVGNTFFRFTEVPPAIEEIPSAEEEIPVPESEIAFSPMTESRWLLKVIAGPNAGAEFSMQKSTSYLIGKDPNTCDIVFHDLSVSRQHARLSVDDEENVYIEDLASRNGVIVNGELITEKTLLQSQDLVALGTTTLLIVDRNKARETIISPALAMPPPSKVATTEEGPRFPKEPPKDWKETIIPKRHLIIVGVFAFLLLIGIAGMFSLLKTEPVIVKQIDESEKIQEVITRFPAVQFSFNQGTGKLFLVGHVLTPIDKQELIYLIKQLPFVVDIEDNIIVDEFVWQNMNALLSTNPQWVGVSVYAPIPGKFVLRGYLKTLDEAEPLSDYVNLNFPYLDRLENQVVIESNLMTEIESLLVEKGFPGVTFQLSNGEVVLSGRAEDMHTKNFSHLITQFKSLPGIRIVKNYVVFTKEDTSQIDLSNQYQVTGYSKGDEANFFVVINGRILGQGDLLDGMKITQVKSNLVVLEKDGLKYKINYNLQ